MFRKIKILFFLTSMILMISGLWFRAEAQNRVQKSSVYFGIGSAAFNKELRKSSVDSDEQIKGETTIQNQSTLLDSDESLKILLGQFDALTADPRVQILKVEIESFASPEGDLRLNNRLSAARGQEVADILIERYAFDESTVSTHNHGIAWDQLRAMVAKSEIKGKEGIINIIDLVPVETWRRVNPTDRYMTLVDSRIKHLMDYRRGVPYRTLYREIFPHLRSASVVTLYFRREVELINPQVVIPHAPAKTEVIVLPTPTPIEVAPTPTEPEITVAPHTESTPAPKPITPPKPLFALKTNALYDLALTPNLELEVPIGKRWSIGAQGMYGWWLKKDNSFCWQIQAADLEARYWFGDRTDRRVMTGWFAGLFTSAGFYDFQLHPERGVQGELYVLTGLSGGYSMPLGNNFYLEFAAGIGYLVSDYQKYRVAGGEYLIEDAPQMRFQALFPAKLEVSLGWLFFNKKRGGSK